MNFSQKQHHLLKTDQIMVIDMLVTIFVCDLPAICIYRVVQLNCN